ncbi:MAG: hypothetical protein KDD67_13875 [Ignavibacteriae bacterium]|nr:hypothetical protein [Ignavibacteriota bacterium]MCB9216124.1 hypothetical protein [Ignavibacteria bacterium]
MGDKKTRLPPRPTGWRVDAAPHLVRYYDAERKFEYVFSDKRMQELLDGLLVAPSDPRFSAYAKDRYQKTVDLLRETRIQINDFQKTKKMMIKTDAELTQQQSTAKSIMTTLDQLNPLLKQAKKEGLRVNLTTHNESMKMECISTRVDATINASFTSPASDD